MLAVPQAAKGGWTQDEVRDILKKSVGGPKVLGILDKVDVYRVDLLKFEYKERPTTKDPWSKEKTGFASGLHLDPDPKHPRGRIFIADRVPGGGFGGGLEPMSAARAVLTLVHEAAHATQDPKEPLWRREVEAFKEQVWFLLRNPALMKQLSKGERAFFEAFIKKDGKAPDVDAIVSHWQQHYEKFAGGDEKKARAMTTTPEEQWPTGKRSQLKNWK
jgi:hypothetical protein